jgi:hypothetical protein
VTSHTNDIWPYPSTSSTSQAPSAGQHANRRSLFASIKAAPLRAGASTRQCLSPTRWRSTGRIPGARCPRLRPGAFLRLTGSGSRAGGGGWCGPLSTDSTPATASTAGIRSSAMVPESVPRIGCQRLLLVEPGGAPPRERCGPDRPGHAPPLRVGEAGDRRQGTEPFPRGSGDGGSDGMFARVLQRAGEPQDFVLVLTLGGHHVDETCVGKALRCSRLRTGNPQTAVTCVITLRVLPWPIACLARRPLSGPGVAREWPQWPASGRKGGERSGKGRAGPYRKTALTCGNGKPEAGSGRSRTILKGLIIRRPWVRVPPAPPSAAGAEAFSPATLSCCALASGGLAVVFGGPWCSRGQVRGHGLSDMRLFGLSGEA